MTNNSLYVDAESRKALWVLPVILMIGSHHTDALDLCTGPMRCCRSVSARDEFIEWFAAIIGGGEADAVLGTQGEIAGARVITCHRTAPQIHQHSICIAK